jgi:hypothetical protein
MPNDAVLCVECGFDRRLARTRTTRVLEDGAGEGFQSLPLRLEEAGPVSGIFAAFGFLWVVLGTGFFSCIFLAMAIVGRRLGAVERLGAGAGGIGLAIATAFFVLLGVRMLIGPQPWLDQTIHRLKWVSGAIIVTAAGGVVWMFWRVTH